MQGVCFNCFHYAPEGQPCPYCGYDASGDAGKYRLALQPGTILANRYLIGRVLGQGGFGVTYVALDSQTRTRVAVKEYLPTEFVVRAQDGVSLTLISTDHEADYEYGKQQFIAEARTLSQFIGNEHIIGIHAMFEANGTAYFAMEYVEGVNLKKFMEQNGGPLPVHVANRILMPIMEALDWVHSKGIVHRDIAPDNIMIRSDGKAKLIDFGAARYSTGEKSKSLDVILKHGFAPYEQYSRRGRQGPFTDVYAMAATYYYAITGKVPTDAVDRIEEEELQRPSTLGVKIRQETEDVLLKGLAFLAKNRYQTMAEFYTALLASMPRPFEAEAETGETPAQVPVRQEVPAPRPAQPVRESAPQPNKEEPKPAPQPQKKPEPIAEKPKKKTPIIAIAAILAGCILAGVLFGTGVFGKKRTAVQETANSSTSVVEEIYDTTSSGDFKTVGSIVTFGSYEQDNDPENGKEPIEWIVLDVQDGKSLIISKYALDCKKYNNIWADVTWETGSLRKWLNSSFLSEAFSTWEQAKVLSVTVTADKNPYYNTDPGKDTQDRVFLLSIPEVQKYFASDAERQCKPTAYAVAQGCNIDPDQNGACWWWLRSPGNYSNFAALVDYFGVVLSYGNFVHYDDYAVRPALWVETEKAMSVAPADSQDQQPPGDPKTVGSIFTFGSYEQDNDPTNGKEPIEWIILDVQDGRYLLISRYVLDYQPYGPEGAEAFWETSSMREWLNDSFLKEAFTAEEQERIPTVTVTADRNPDYDTIPGNDTQDKVFLLSIPEVNEYLHSIKETNEREVFYPEQQCKPTAFAVAKGCSTNSDFDGSCAWCLRSTGYNTHSVAYVLVSGGIHTLGFEIDGTGDSVRPALWLDLNAPSLTTVGSTVTFGSFEQDSDPENGKEPIEWIVLDVQDGRSLLLSKYALDCQQYNTKDAKVTWETCSLRTWLNGSFLNDAFSSEELARIPKVSVTADKNPNYDADPGKDTQDRVFLLSIPEVNEYFASDPERACKPTAFAEEQGCYVNSGGGTCWWWLRSPGLSVLFAAAVFDDGSIGVNGSDVRSNYGIRPALWINLDS